MRRRVIWLSFITVSLALPYGSSSSRSRRDSVVKDPTRPEKVPYTISWKPLVHTCTAHHRET